MSLITTRRAEIVLVCITAVLLSCRKSETPLGGVPTPAPQTTAKTRLEAFRARYGAVIVSGFSRVSELRGEYGGTVAVDAKEFTDVSSGKRERGMTVEVKEAGTLERENTSYVDYDEIESLLKGFDYIVRVDKATATRLADFQADYRTRGDLTISAFSTSDGNLLGVSSGQIGGTAVYFRPTRAPQIRAAIADAKATLDQIDRGTTPTLTQAVVEGACDFIASDNQAHCADMSKPVCDSLGGTWRGGQKCR